MAARASSDCVRQRLKAQLNGSISRLIYVAGKHGQNGPYVNGALGITQDTIACRRNHECWIRPGKPQHLERVGVG